MARDCWQPKGKGKGYTGKGVNAVEGWNMGQSDVNWGWPPRPVEQPYVNNVNLGNGDEDEEGEWIRVGKKSKTCQLVDKQRK